MKPYTIQANLTKACCMQPQVRTLTAANKTMQSSRYLSAHYVIVSCNGVVCQWYRYIGHPNWSRAATSIWRTLFVSFNTGVPIQTYQRCYWSQPRWCWWEKTLIVPLHQKINMQQNICVSASRFLSTSTLPFVVNVNNIYLNWFKLLSYCDPIRIYNL